ncbi:MAG: PilZ domain-containing protein [Spirochaetia bacterium]|nr:PilZ domain-containing protein [Spirochaetia bacterium]
MIELRKDSDRSRLNSPCSVLYRAQTFKANLVDVSRTGCRLEMQDQIYLPSGATIDVFVTLGDAPCLITGHVINSIANNVGIATLAMSDSAQRRIGEALRAQLSGNRTGSPPSVPRKVLALGAGGGKILGQLKMLETLEAYLGGPITDHFDMLAGCSSGALILAMIARGSSIAEIRTTITGNIKGLGFAGMFALSNLISKAGFHNGIDESFGSMQMAELTKPLFTLSRNFKSSIHKTYSTWSEGNLRISTVLKRATAIPVLMGAHENEMDGGAGLYINPVEIFLRVLRHSGSLAPDLQVLYLDSGFDPLGRPEGFAALNDNVISQLFWIIGTMQRDLNVLATDRIVNEFPNVKYTPYFFTYSRSYDLSKTGDFYAAESEVEGRADQFRQWLVDCFGR